MKNPNFIVLSVLLVLVCVPSTRVYAESDQSNDASAQAESDIDQVHLFSDAVAGMNRASRSRQELLRKFAGEIPGPDFSGQFVKETIRIAMRDGIELHTEVYRPNGQSVPLPIILVRTPYGLSPDVHGFTARLRMYPELIKDGYIFVIQDISGRGSSDGEHVSLRPLRDKTDPLATDESTDAFDAIEWLVNNVTKNNGRVGMLGISYGGFLTTRALVDPHPALRAASPQATCADMFIGDDWHHNGAFRLEYAFNWISRVELSKGFDNVDSRYDSYESFLELGALSNIDKKFFHGRAPSWNAFAAHPNLDSYWTEENCGVFPHVQDVTVPTLNVVGWFDAEDFYGPIELYKKYEATDKNNINHLVMGPWYHGGWSFSPEGRYLGEVDFESNTAHYYRTEIQAPWFAYWLKDKGELNLPEVVAFQTGDNSWKEYDSWPPAEDTVSRNLYFHANGKLSFDRPLRQEPGFDEYVSDPSKPVPYYPRPITSLYWSEWKMADQRFVDGRPDVLTYMSEPLDSDITIAGEPIAHLFASTSGSDSDWIVKLIDVYPEGYPRQHMSGFQFMIADEVFRARYRDSFRQPKPVIPGDVVQYEINLRSRNHTFREGHRIMVQVQSTWFPLIDRNPQSYVENIYKAQDDDFISATQRIYRTGSSVSHISLPVLRVDRACLPNAKSCEN